MQRHATTALQSAYQENILPPSRSGSGMWHRTTVRDIVTNPIYIIAVYSWRAGFATWQKKS
jgi:hypothetical protein